MGAAFTALKEESRRLLAAVRAGAEGGILSELLHSRMQLLQEFETAAAGGERIGAGEIQEIQEIEREIRDALAHRRDAVYRELVSLRRARTAELAYGTRSARAPIYLDREG